jgi:dTDP-4-amino-4,6-dideoxygalactose transaminase
MVLPENIDRSELMLKCKEVGIPTSVYYIKPLHLQKAYNRYPIAEKGGLKVCEHLAENVLSIPMHPYLSEAHQQYIIDRLNEIVLSFSK